MEGQYTIKTAIIESGENLSNTIDLRGYKFYGIIMPSSWTTANLTFQGSYDGISYYDVYMDGVEVVESAQAGRLQVINANLFAIATLPFLKIRSGTSSTPVAQGAQRTISILCSY